MFRDESDFTGTEYFSAVQVHLDGSRKLVILCSPQAAASSFVNDEVRRFAVSHSSTDIVPVLFAGTPNNEVPAGGEALNAFPPALLEAQSIPLAADFRGFRPNRDKISSSRFRSAWHKLLADLLDRSRAEIDQREKKRRQERWVVVGAAAIALVGASAWSLATWWQQRLDAEASALWHGLAGSLRDSAPALVSVTRIDANLRSAFINAALGSPTIAARALEAPEIVVRSVVGLSSTRRAEMLDHLRAAPPSLHDPVLALAQTLLTVHLHDPDSVLRAFDAARTTASRVEQRALIDGVMASSASLAPEYSSRMAGIAVAWISGPSPHTEPMRVLSTLQHRLTDDQLAVLASATIAKITASTDKDSADNAAAALKAVATRLSATERERIGELAARALETSSGPEAYGFIDLVERLATNRSAERALEAAVVRAEHAFAEPWRAQHALNLLTTLSRASTNELAARASAAAASAVTRAPASQASRSKNSRKDQLDLGLAQQALMLRLGSAATDRAEAPWLGVLRTSRASGVVEAAARALQGRKAGVASTFSSEVEAVLLKSIGTTDELGPMAALVAAWAARAPQVAMPPLVRAATKKLLAAVAKPDSKATLVAVAALATVAPRFSTADAAVATYSLLAALSDDPRVLLAAVHDDGAPPELRSGSEWLGAALEALAPRLDAAAAGQAALQLSATILRLDDLAAANDLSVALRALVLQARAKPGDLLDIALREAWMTTTRQAALTAHVRALAQTGLAGIAESPTTTVRRLLTVKPGLSWNPPWEAHGEALRQLLRALPLPARSVAVAEVVSAMRKATDESTFKRLGTMLAVGLDGDPVPAAREAMVVVAAAVANAPSLLSAADSLEVLTALPFRLEASESIQVCQRLVREFSTVATEGSPSALANSVARVVAKLPNDSAAAVLTFEALKVPWMPATPFAQAWRQRLAPGSAQGVPYAWWDLAQWGRRRFTTVNFEDPMAQPEVVLRRLQEALQAESSGEQLKN